MAGAVGAPSPAVASPGRDRRSRPGGDEPVTPEIACRVSERVALGLSVPLALAAERNPQLDEAAWETALARHPEWASAFAAVKARFCDYALRQVFDGEGKNLKWLCRLLERRYPDLFRRVKAEDAAAPTSTQDDRAEKPRLMGGMTPEQVRYMQEQALKL